MLNAITPQRAAYLILFVALVTIVGAWIFEWAGYLPCELCLKQRWAYYTGIPMALVVGLLAGRGSSATQAGLWLLALLWVASTISASIIRAWNGAGGQVPPPAPPAGPAV